MLGQLLDRLAKAHGLAPGVHPGFRALGPAGSSGAAAGPAQSPGSVLTWLAVTTVAPHSDPEARLAELGLALPDPPPTLANYTLAVRHGDLLYLAGMPRCGRAATATSAGSAASSRSRTATTRRGSPRSTCWPRSRPSSAIWPGSGAS